MVSSYLLWHLIISNKKYSQKYFIQSPLIVIIHPLKHSGDRELTTPLAACSTV